LIPQEGAPVFEILFLPLGYAQELPVTLGANANRGEIQCLEMCEI
jgi:hypothetical protein